MTTPEQTFGRCKVCRKYTIKTIHIECGHLHCCLTCSRKCRQCRALGCQQEHPNHLHIFSGCPMHSSMIPEIGTAQIMNEGHDNPCELDDHISIEVNEVRRPEMERDNRVQDDYDLTLPYYNRILPGDCADDELYDPRAIHTPGCCGACQCELIKYFLVAYDEEDISHQCGHGVCRNCYTRLTADQNSDYLFLCPVCRRQVQMFVEAQF